MLLILGLALGPILCAFGAWDLRSLRRLWKKQYWLVFTHVLFVAAAIVVQSAFAVPLTLPPLSRHPNRPGMLLLDVIFWSSLGSCAFWIWRMKELRSFALGLVWTMEIMVVWALFIAGMGVSGDWL